MAAGLLGGNGPDGVPGVLRFSGIAIWLAAMAGGWALLQSHEYTPGERPRHEAAGRGHHLEILPGNGQPVVFFFAHPRCPCTLNSFSELNDVLARHPAAKAMVVFTVPQAADTRWLDTTLVRQTNAHPRMEAIFDRGGFIANAFGAAISGTTMVFDADGKLVYHGGLTSSRSHEGSGPGVPDLHEALSGSPRVELAEHEVFGCRLILPEGTGA